MEDAELLATFRAALVAERRRQWGLSGTVDTEDGATLAGLRAVLAAAEPRPVDRYAPTVAWLQARGIEHEVRGANLGTLIMTKPFLLPGEDRARWFTFNYGPDGLFRHSFLEGRPWLQERIDAVNAAIIEGIGEPVPVQTDAGTESAS